MATKDKGMPTNRPPGAQAPADGSQSGPRIKAPFDLRIDPAGRLGNANRPFEGPEWETLERETNRRARQRRQATQRGDVRRLLEQLTADPPGPNSMGMDPTVSRLDEDLQNLTEAVRNRSRQDLDGLVDDVLAETAASLSLVILRGHRVLRRRIGLQDRHATQDPNRWLVDDVRDTLVPSLVDLTLQLAELQRLMAATRRQNELARTRRQANDGSRPPERVNETPAPAMPSHGKRAKPGRPAPAGKTARSAGSPGKSPPPAPARSRIPHART